MPPTSPIQSVRGVPAIITARRSRPARSVPRGKPKDGGRLGGTESGRDLTELSNNGPTKQKSASARSRATPTARLGFRRVYRDQAAISLGPLVDDSWIKQWVCEVKDKGGSSDRKNHR